VKTGAGAALYRAKDYESSGFPDWRGGYQDLPKPRQRRITYLGAIALQERRLGEAHNELELALKRNQDYVDALAELGQYYLMQKDYSQAESRIRRALELDPEHYTANFYLLTLYKAHPGCEAESTG